ncbi:SUKH-4 family immunity protein [Streptomyces sp. NPDC008125]|uniref:SUKH-4 family immunity protein n=1 Tax=Streptomyces sp. NPDC008125 TaxID=3364811 RepID=UPI0036E3B66A
MSGSSDSVTVPAHALHPLLTHEPTRMRLTGPGLPLTHELIRFAPLAQPRVARVAELLTEDADPAELHPHVRDLLRVGHLLCEGAEAQEVVLDGATGRVFSMDLFEDAPGLIDVVPLAPSLDALARFLGEVDDLRASRGRFAVVAAGPRGTEAVARACELLAAVFAEEDWGGGGWGSAGAPDTWEHPVPALWRISATIRPLALVAGPGEGLRLDLPKGLLEAEFGPEDLVRTEPSALPAGLVHEPTRRFLAEVGLPRTQLMFGLWSEETLLRPLVEVENARDADPVVLPADADRLFCLGSLVEDMEVVVDGVTGLLSYRPYGEDALVPINADVSTLAFTLWMFGREQRLDAENDFTADFYHQLADAMVAVLASVDPVACLPPVEDDYRYWPEVFHDEAGAVLHG